jgi:hypothetical protein
VWFAREIIQRRCQFCAANEPVAARMATCDSNDIRPRQHRYIRYEDGSEELYGHATDPHEWTNLASSRQHQKIVAQFRRELPQRNAKYHPATKKGPSTPGSSNIWSEMASKIDDFLAMPAGLMCSAARVSSSIGHECVRRRRWNPTTDSQVVRVLCSFCEFSDQARCWFDSGCGVA